MNLYKEGCLKQDPFYGYHDSGWSKNDNGKWETKTNEKKYLANPTPKYKYQFALKMLSIQKQIKKGKSEDERGIARLKYAIGRRNSFEECWALTQYWHGRVGLFEPMLYYSDIKYIKKYDEILYDYVKTIGSQKTEKIYQEEINAAIAMLQSDEYKAEAEYILGNLKKIVKQYGNTAVAQHIKTSCDNWRSWL